MLKRTPYNRSIFKAQPNKGRNTKPRFLRFAEVNISIRVLNDNFLSITTPRSLISSTLLRAMPLTLYPYKVSEAPLMK